MDCVSGMYSFISDGSRTLPPYDLLRIIKYEEICYCDRLYLFIVLQTINISPPGGINNSSLNTAKNSMCSSFPAESENALVIKFSLNDLVQCFNLFFPWLLPAITEYWCLPTGVEGIKNIRSYFHDLTPCTLKIKYETLIEWSKVINDNERRIS